MSPKTEFIVVLGVLLLAAIGVMILLLITSTPRSIDYTLSRIGCPSETTESYIDQMEIPEHQVNTTLYEVLYEFGVIRTEDDLSDTSVDLSVYDTLLEYTHNPADIPMTMLYQADPRTIITTRDYMHYQNTGKRTLFFIQTKDDAEEYVISAFNNNLRSRQIAVFVFFQHKDSLFGYVLNNVWMRPRNYTFINLLVDTQDSPVLITDLDDNVYSCVDSTS
ncbi:hypothetical protein NEOKW01_1410 [Nematocida sp. AWRm80]|nr:hypothetical protein NEOKW01_1410 [Nematocida sp. AWRm80]